MVSSKHTTTVEVIAETRQAEKAIDRLQQKIDGLSGRFAAASGDSGGGGSSGGEGGGGSGNTAAFAALAQAAAKLDRVADKLMTVATRLSNAGTGGGGGGGVGGGGGGGGGAGGGGRGGGRRRGEAFIAGTGQLAMGGANQAGAIPSMLGTTLASMESPMGSMGLIFGAMGVGMQFAGAAMNQGFAAAQGLGGLEKVTSRGEGLAGGLTAPGALGLAGTGGLGHQEIAGQRLAFQMSMGRARGGTGSGQVSTTDMIRLSLGAGVGASTLGSIAGVTTGIGGAENADVERSISLGVEAGFKGAKLERFLSEMVGAVDNLQRMGLPVDLQNVENLRAGMIGAGIQSTAVTPFTSAGMGMIGQARNQLLSPFRQLGQQAILGQALRGGGGFRGALGRLEGMSADPGSAFGGQGSAISGFAGPMSDLVFASMGLSKDDAATFAGMDVGAAGQGRMGTRVTMPTGTKTASTLARFEADRIEKLQPKDLKAMTKTMLDLQVAIKQFEGVGLTLATTITDNLAPVIAKSGEIIDDLKDFLKSF